MNVTAARNEVLWVRFCEEDDTFDYEKLSAICTYHNFRIEDAHKLCDKYVKGLEYPVVVIEGFPRFMDKTDEESRMWSFRRELYLCASRATCFLYLICNAAETIGEDTALRRIKAEITRLVEAVAMPVDPYTNGVREWKFNIRGTPQRRKLSVFDEVHDKNETGEVASVSDSDAIIKPLVVVNPVEAPPVSNPQSVRFTGPPTARELATVLGLKQFQLNRDLFAMDIFVSPNHILDFDVAAAICAKHGKTYVSDYEAKDAVVREIDTSGSEPSQAAISSKGTRASNVEVQPSETTSNSVPSIKGQVVDLISPRRTKRAEQSPPELKATFQTEPTENFAQKVDVSNTMSVIQFARTLGVQHREVINWLVRQGRYATGSYLLDVATMRSIAREYKLGINVLE